MTARQMLAKGQFNNMSQQQLPDGSVRIRLTRRGDPQVYSLLVKDLYKPTEKILEDKIIKENS